MKHSFVILFFFTLFIGCQSEPSLKIATSANMQFALEEIAIEFEKSNDIKIELVVSSTGTLTSQIEQGAPYDLFVAANMKYPTYLHQKKLTTTPPKIYAYGQLILCTMYDFEPSLSYLKKDDIQKIAIANPETAPYGIASLEVLKKYNLYASVKSKLVYGESVSQCNQFINTQSVNIGFTAMSVVMSDKMKNKGHWVKINTNNYSPIKQGVVILKNSTQKDNAKLFYNFLFSTQAQVILKKYGYLNGN